MVISLTPPNYSDECVRGEHSFRGGLGVPPFSSPACHMPIPVAACVHMPPTSDGKPCDRFKLLLCRRRTWKPIPLVSIYRCIPMEGGHQLDHTEKNMAGEVPSSPKDLASIATPGSDYAGDGVLGMNNTPSNLLCANGVDAEASKSQANLENLQLRESTVQANRSHQSHTISIDMPASSTGRKILFIGEADQQYPSQEQPHFPPRTSVSGVLQQPNLVCPDPTPAAFSACRRTADKDVDPAAVRRSKSDRMRDKRFDPFKTWSGRLERQISNLRGRPQEEEEEEDNGSLSTTEITALPVERYFDALEGPELDVLKPSEESVLPEDKLWPFLLRFPISSFGICLGVSSQAILWKTLATSPSTKFLHISPSVNFVLWCVALALLASVFFTYSFKVIFYFEAVRREYHHPVRVNFFFSPWIACLFLSLGVPPSIVTNLHGALWYAIMAPILCLQLKIYGQWMSGGKRRLSKVANPSNHLAIVGNFVGALLGASMGLKEVAAFFFAVGLAHYIVLFVTLYQRLPTNESLPKELHPVFFLFVAAPSVACMAWAKIRGDFDYGSRIAYFIALFLYFSLVVRINFFRGFRFSLAWWAYTFPMTGAAIATIRYSMEVKNSLTLALSLALSAVSTFTVTALLAATVVHAFVLRDLFPNDNAIAITERRTRLSKKQIHRIFRTPYTQSP
ncbi:hypothetical protein Taro_026354 [Colocasia esculenta]|uniref:S-type anion channel n=1 Tax=Colocasia esculenta TaxID=4460 RepID=A0A843VBQ4_COLES|nr:hypothetical protein [Colocasia esculenta]